MKNFEKIEPPVRPLRNEQWTYTTISKHYLVSTQGRVYSTLTHKLLKRGTSNGYKVVSIHGKNVKVHRLVADAFIENPHNLPFVNHKDENRGNNKVENLEWCSPSYNINYGTANHRRAEKMLGKERPDLTKYSCVVMSDADTDEFLDMFVEMKDAVNFIEGFGEAEDEQSIRANIQSCIRGITETAYGYKWEAILQTK